MPRLTVVLLTIWLGLLVGPAAGQQRGTVSRIIDGDTIEVIDTAGKALTVRLIGIDTPESKKPGTPVECGALEAAAHLESLAASQPVTLTADPTQESADRYGRLLAYVTLDDGRDIAEAQIAAGWAGVYVYDGKPFQRFEIYNAAQSAARDAGRGVWAACEGNFHSEGAIEATQLRGSWSVREKVTYSRLSYRPGQSFRNEWRFLPVCSSASCAVKVVRRFSNGSAARFTIRPSTRGYRGEYSYLVDGECRNKRTGRLLYTVKNWFRTDVTVTLRMRTGSLAGTLTERDVPRWRISRCPAKSRVVLRYSLGGEPG